MTEASEVSSSMRTVPDGVSESEFDKLLDAGRRRGYVTQEDLVEVLRSVELSHEVIAPCRATFAAGTPAQWLVLRPQDEAMHYRFRWESFTLLNESMANVTLIDVYATSADQR